jgi:hypothetical protein
MTMQLRSRCFLPFPPRTEGQDRLLFAGESAGNFPKCLAQRAFLAPAPRSALECPPLFTQTNLLTAAVSYQSARVVEGCLTVTGHTY